MRRHAAARPARLMRPAAALLATGLAAALAAGLAACAPTDPIGSAGMAGSAGKAAAPGSAGNAAAGKGQILAVAAENQYGDVIAQVGGRYVAVTSIMTNPATDPHTFEASPRLAQALSAARLVVQNGLGYDQFMNTIEDAQPSSQRKVIDVQHLLNLPDSTENPHLWYQHGTMTVVASQVADDLASLDPPHASYFKANAQRFAAGQQNVTKAIAAFKSKYRNVTVATTEPVADYLLQAVQAGNLTPWTFQADIMNGTDPSPQDIAAERSLFTGHKVKAFLYNRQVTSSLTESFIALARQNGIPVVGVYETMPTPGYDYQSWMLAELNALTRAIADKTSTEQL